MKKVVIFGLTLHKFPEEIPNYHVTQISSLKKVSFVESMLRTLLLHISPIKTIKYYNVNLLLNTINDADIVILFDAFPTEVIEEICRLIDNTSGNKLGCYFYYWNPVIGHKQLNLSSKWNRRCFDYKDSLKYNIPYVSTFFVPLEANEIVEKSDIFFVGKNKGRFSGIRNLEKELSEKDINCIFKYVSGLSRIYPKRYSSKLPYSKVLSYVKQTRCILDITQKGQVGLTQRFMEALYYGKKIITNNKDVVNYALFHSDNVCIIDIDTNKISCFVKNGEACYKDNIIKWYSPESWIERIIHPGDTDYVQGADHYEGD